MKLRRYSVLERAVQGSCLATKPTMVVKVTVSAKAKVRVKVLVKMVVGAVSAVKMVREVCRRGGRVVVFATVTAGAGPGI